MKRKGFTLVEIMIVVAIIALLAAIAVPNLLSAKKTANEAAAKANVRSFSTAAETYATANNGAYPVDVTALATYVNAAASYCGASVQGYTYACTLAATGYTISAAPVSTATGTTTYTATTGGVLAPL